MPAVVWKGYVSFGLISFPVRLFSAGRAEALHFHMLHRKDLSRVKEVWFCAKEDKRIDRSDIVKGYEVSKDEYIVVEDEDLKKVAPATATTMEIQQFVREADVDPIYFERSYYVAPGDNVSKPYELFSKALKETKYSALARVSMHGREHIVLIRSAGESIIMHTLFYPDELHEANRQKVPRKASSTRKELELATKLIEQLAGPFRPGEFRDTYRENVERLIEQKRKGQKITTEPKPKRAPVIDLMEALKKSLKSSASLGTPVRAAAVNKTKRRSKAA